MISVWDVRALVDPRDIVKDACNRSGWGDLPRVRYSRVVPWLGDDRSRYLVVDERSPVCIAALQTREAVEMRFKAVFGSGAAVLALSVGVVAGAATAGTSAPCGGSAVFAAAGDSSPYVQMHAIGKKTTAADGSLTLAGSSSAAFKGSCVAYRLPQVRLFAMNNGDAAATLRVSVQYKDSANQMHDETIGTLSSGSSTMQQSPAFAFDGSLVKGNVQVTLTSGGSGASWIIGGVYIDPYKVT
jgi:hypothetical protein